MDLSDWTHLLEPNERAYVHQCFKFWQGHNGERAPLPPDGISKARGDTLLYHTKSLMDTAHGKRKMERPRGINLKAPREFYQRIEMTANEIETNVSAVIRCCVELSLETVRKHPELIYTLKAVIPK